jgi:hypothetical protein
MGKRQGSLHFLHDLTLRELLALNGGLYLEDSNNLALQPLTLQSKQHDLLLCQQDLMAMYVLLLWCDQTPHGFEFYRQKYTCC